MISKKRVRTEHPGPRRQKWLLGLLTAVALSLAMIRLGPRLARETAADPGVAEPHAPDAVTQCAAGAFLASRPEWPLELHRDLFRWEDLFEQPIAQESPPPRDLEREAAEALQLQGIMLGQTPRALINGALREEGDSVEGFRISRIEGRRISVEKDGVTVELKL